MEKRKTYKDYHREFEELKKARLSLNAHLTQRLVELCQIHSEVAKEIHPDYFQIISDGQGGGMPIEIKLMFMKKIEKESSKLQKVIQQKFNI